MPPRSRNPNYRSTRRRCVVAVTLLCHCLATFGFPLPAPTAQARRDASQPYPCMNHPCGCLSAEQCWQSCCCFSARERLAWAEEHGVAVPDALRREAEREPGPPPACSQCEGHSGGCCGDEGNPIPSCGDCPESKPEGGEGEGASTPDQGTSTGSAFVWVVGLSARRCQGEDGASLFAHVPVTVGPGLVVWTFDFVCVSRLSHLHFSAASIRPVPEAPPPRS